MKNLLHIVKRDRGLNALQVCLACFPAYFLFFLSQQPSHVDPKNLCMNGHFLQLQGYQDLSRKSEENKSFKT